MDNIPHPPGSPPPCLRPWPSWPPGDQQLALVRELTNFNIYLLTWLSREDEKDDGNNDRKKCRIATRLWSRCKMYFDMSKRKHGQNCVEVIFCLFFFLPHRIRLFCPNNAWCMCSNLDVCCCIVFSLHKTVSCLFSFFRFISSKSLFLVLFTVSSSYFG